jgi:hypothetical protein
MLNHDYKKRVKQLLLILAVFLVSSCGAQKQSVTPYQDRISPPADIRQEQPETSKSLPTMEDVSSEKDDAVQDRPAGAEKTGPAPGRILPALTLVNDRIVVYEDKLRAWSEFSAEALSSSLDEEQQATIASCQARIRQILDGYNLLHEILLAESSGQDRDLSIPDRYVSVERKDLSFLESDCRQIIGVNRQPGDWLAGTRYMRLEMKEKEIAEALAQRDYLQVIDLFEQLPPESITDVSIDATYAYGQALLRTGNAQKAETVFFELLARIRRDSQLKREFQLMRLVADIDFGLKEYSRSFERYVDIINRYAGLGENVEWARRQQSVIGSMDRKGTEVRSFAELMLAYLTYNAERDGYGVVLLARDFMDRYPDSVQYPTAARILLESGDRAEAWFTGVLEQVSRLETEKKYEEALAFIEQLSGTSLLPEKQDMLRALTDELISAQFEEAEVRRQALERELQETWNLGQTHLRAREYDQAIEVFARLEGTAYSDRAEMQIVEAAQLAAQEIRRKAAELFVQANSMRDLGRKTELLLASRELLQSILVKYPQSDLVEKVKRNLNKIEQEIRDIDPALLDSLPSENTPGSPGPDRPSASDTFSGQENGQTDSSMYTGKDIQEQKL